MDRKEIFKILSDLKVLNKGHFLLTSGKHSDTYLQCAKIFQYPEYSALFAKEIVQRFSGEKIDIVIGPAIGGIIFAYEVARQLGAKALFAEREEGIMKLRRGFEINEGDNVLVVEDVVTTGGSVKEVIEVVKNYNANVVGVACIVDRSNGKVDFGIKFESVISLDVISYESKDCPLCKEGLPVDKPGSRKFK
ncbi:orotate phosphoribosyltransferase [Thermoanaerobacterium thermosaccharolyticum]|uniref:orotate phosphoribosyltransferase n=1 Tax=Thermoanaerobacterium thermosaccharolyticum TaxID=1517 RepID=UPI00177ACABA|nr:orotate phosphoribosyltransferase [Thermoanaerobacterium thermosaccharolyticum]MBE0069368.1 orotate phosphoribosyltransferase [Thermoanaerobacterium thermosaccharolyticum]MBE0228201.1 orotate phosphoribosyltransferase [Thermoanaerobacterium thermosaccharolyticum]MCP2240732.1 orotate phosphoribosyltransferase [Thermoanaerobacterium thermosaccharolyticum]